MTIRTASAGRSRLKLLSAIALAALTIAPRAAIAQGTGYDTVVIQPTAANSSSVVASSYGTVVDLQVPVTGTASIVVPPGTTAQSFALQLQLDSRLAYAEVNSTVGSPEYSANQMQLAFDASSDNSQYVNQGAYTFMDAPSGTKATGQGVIVAVIDTGTTPTHPDLASHLLPGYNVLDPSSPPLDAPDGVVNSAVGHGTMVCGLIARIAPGASILPIRVLNGDGVGTLIDVVAGIEYAIANGARVINLSLGNDTWSQSLANAISDAKAAGVVVVASAGNEGTNMPHYPAALWSVLGVGSVEADYTKSLYSNYGKNVNVLAPGTGIRSTYWTGGYATWSGTSFSAPFVSAEAALLLSKTPGASAYCIRSAILGSSHSVNTYNPGFTGQLGSGLIDIGAALSGYGCDD